jgi:hypothetical protein
MNIPIFISICLAIIIPLIIHNWHDIIDPRNKRRREADRKLAKKIRANKKSWL